MKVALIATIALVSTVFSFAAHANGICGQDKSIFQCFIAGGSLQQVDLCASNKNELYITELNAAGSLRDIPLTQTQLKLLETKNVLQWKCGPKEKQVGTCFTISNLGQDATYKISEFTVSNIGNCQ